MCQPQGFHMFLMRYAFTVMSHLRIFIKIMQSLEPDNLIEMPFHIGDVGSDSAVSSQASADWCLSVLDVCQYLALPTVEYTNIFVTVFKSRLWIHLYVQYLPEVFTSHCFFLAYICFSCLKMCCPLFTLYLFTPYLIVFMHKSMNRPTYILTSMLEFVIYLFDLFFSYYILYSLLPVKHFATTLFA